MAKKLNLNELRILIRQVIKEETRVFNKTYENFKKWIANTDHFEKEDEKIEVKDFTIKMLNFGDFLADGYISVHQNDEMNEDSGFSSAFLLGSFKITKYKQSADSLLYGILKNEEIENKPAIITPILGKYMPKFGFYYNNDGTIQVKWNPTNTSSSRISNDMAFAFYQDYYLPNIEKINKEVIEKEFQDEADFLNRISREDSFRGVPMNYGK